MVINIYTERVIAWLTSPEGKSSSKSEKDRHKSKPEQRTPHNNHKYNQSSTTLQTHNFYHPAPYCLSSSLNRGTSDGVIEVEA